jgi:hypothetical protein
LWANIYITNEVHDQLAAQKITMPTDETGLADLPADDKAALEPYAGQPMTTGSQARAYADHFIAVHLSEVADGKTYSEVSGEYLASCSDPTAAASDNCQTLSTQKATLFQGETLRGLLLYGAAFATVGTSCLVRRDRRLRGSSGAPGARDPRLPPRPEDRRGITGGVT